MRTGHKNYTLVVALMLAVAPVAHAQDAATGSGHAEERSNYERARALFLQATAAYSREDFASARKLFEAAHEIEPGAATLRALGFCDFRLRQYVLAIKELRAALAEPRGAKALTGDQQRAVHGVLQQMEPFVGHLILESDPEQIIVELDGHPVEGHEFWLLPGDHTLIAAARGYRTSTLEVSIVAGREQQTSLSLSRIQQPVLAAPKAAAGTRAGHDPIVANTNTSSREHAKADADSGDDPAGAGRTRGIIGLSIGVAALAIGIVTGHSSAKKTSHEALRCTQGHCPLDSKDALAAANTMANIANISFGISALGLAYGLYELLTLPASAPVATKTRGMRVQLSGFGIAVHGTL